MMPDALVSLPVSPPRIEPQQVVAMGLRGPGFWKLAACRIVYVVHDDEILAGDTAAGHPGGLPTHRFGFAYGTLPCHVERGEELFLVEMDRLRNVTYQIASFSKAFGTLSWLGQLLIRHFQRRFRQASMAAMRSAVDCGLAR